jgi:hypothetical protein
MNKLMLALATVATLGLSTAAFAQNPATSTPAARAQGIQSTQLKAPVAHKMRASHRTNVKKVVVVHRRVLHRGAWYARHHGYDNGKKVVVKHITTTRTPRTKAAS